MTESLRMYNKVKAVNTLACYKGKNPITIVQCTSTANRKCKDYVSRRRKQTLTQKQEQITEERIECSFNRKVKGEGSREPSLVGR